MIRRKKKFKFDLSFPSMQPKVFQRLGETQATDIEVTVTSEGVPYNLTGVRFGFEMRDDAGKIVIDEDQTRFTLTDVTKGKFTYRVDDRVFGFEGNAYLCYFVLKISGVRITTERFIVTNDEDVQKNTTGLREHYVSVIDDLIASNKAAMEEAQKIKDMIAANQVVKKTGDTMTGTLGFDITVNQRRIQWVGNNLNVGLNASDDVSTQNFSLVDYKNNRTIWSYEPLNNALNFRGDLTVPWVKKTGDTITGLLTTTDNFRFKAGGERNITWRNGDDTEYIKLYANSGGNRLGLWSTKNNKAVWEYHGDNDIFNVTANTNLLKKTGDTMSGYLRADMEGGERGLLFLDNAGEKVKLYGSKSNYFGLHDIVNNSKVWEFNGNTRTFSVYGNTNLITKDKDGKATLTLTADATNASTGYLPMAIRRGNTVTVRMEVTRNVGSSSALITTLPADMRPTDTLSFNFSANDNSSVSVNITWDGKVEMYVTGKQTKIVATYVVN